MTTPHSSSHSQSLEATLLLPISIKLSLGTLCKWNCKYLPFLWLTHFTEHMSHVVACLSPLSVAITKYLRLG